MTEAEALAIAVKALVSAFVVATPAPAPTPPPPAPGRTPQRKPRRKKPAPTPARLVSEALPADLRPMPDFDLPLSEEPGIPAVSIAELEAMLAGNAPPEGTYAREDAEEVGGGWAGQH